VSTSDFEGLSNSMLEALSMGLPTICTDCPCGGARMVIEDGVNGFLIPVNNQKSLVDKMLLIAGSSELTIKLSNNALKINNKLNVDNICKQWISLL
ncbi:glycosyltransferase, partial [Bacteroides caccae]